MHAEHIGKLPLRRYYKTTKGSKLWYFIESCPGGQDRRVSEDNYRVLRYCGQFNGVRSELGPCPESVRAAGGLLWPGFQVSVRFWKQGNTGLAVCGVECKPIIQFVDFNSYLKSEIQKRSKFLIIKLYISIWCQNQINNSISNISTLQKPNYLQGLTTKWATKNKYQRTGHNFDRGAPDML